MTQFTVLYLARSDGKLDIVGKNRLWEKNEPTAKQLDQTPDAKGVSDYYRFTTSNEQKHLDWRRKLAGMLMRELGGRELSLDKSYILYDLPENYRLYEHVKSKATDADGKPAKNPKNHAGGGHDRQDAYLYGHPLGRKKRFRSPADFFPHLLWLVKDETADPKNCSCKICSPDELQPETKTVELNKDIVMKEEDIALRPVVHGHPVVQIPTRAPSNTQIRRSSSTLPPTTASPAPQVPTPQPNAASPLPQPQSPDQAIDASYGRFTFRPGELIWFNREVAWGLAVVLRRWIIPGAPPLTNRAYIVQPLSEPYHHDAVKVVKSENDMRPWLAWSPPAFCHDSLNRITGLTYDTADWQGIRNGAYGSTTEAALTIDASILAAKAIDSSYSLFGFVKTNPGPDTGVESLFNGVYLGGEKLWIGEPVRLRMSTGVSENVLVISSVIERIQTSYAGAKTTKVVVRGDIYTCSSVKPPQQPPPQSQDSSTIPARMIEDLKQRNRASAASASTAPNPSNPNPQTFFWKLIGANTTLSLSDIKGRWYESSIMLPIINTPQAYIQDLRAGKIESVDRYLNARSECGKTDGLRKDRREDAFGAAVPRDARVVEGLSVPSLPVERPTSTSGFREDAAMGDAGTGSVDDFLNLDGIDSSGFQGGVGGVGGGFGSQGEYFR